MVDALICSSCGEAILGAAAVMGQPDEALEQGLSPWETEGDVVVHHAANDRAFMVLHPKCMHQVLDEVLRQEKATVVNIALGSVADVRAALEM